MQMSILSGFYIEVKLTLHSSKDYLHGILPSKLLQLCQAQGGAKDHQQQAEGKRRARVTQIFVTAADSTLSFFDFVAGIFLVFATFVIAA